MADARTPTNDTAVYLYLDIETIPPQDVGLMDEIARKHVVPEVDLSAIVAASNLTDTAKIEADISKRRLKAMDDYDADHAKAQAAAEEEYRKTCLDATTGHIACIYATFDECSISGSSNDALKHFRNCTMTMKPKPVPADDQEVMDFLFPPAEMAS